jgi:hypothetical protein
MNIANVPFSNSWKRFEISLLLTVGAMPSLYSDT